MKSAECYNKYLSHVLQYYRRDGHPSDVGPIDSGMNNGAYLDFPNSSTELGSIAGADLAA
jgi:hypothetical protein